MNQDRFLKLGEVKTRLGVSRSTVWRWTVERGLKVVKVGDVVRIRESDLQAFLKRHEASADPSRTEATGAQPHNSAQISA